MQDGRTLYYQGNTLNRSVSLPSIKKRITQEDEVMPQTVIIPRIDKVFATNQCIWCNRQLDGYQIVCNYCHNCQYCGMVAFNIEQCQTCGNHTDDELTREFQERQTVNFQQ